MNPIQQSIVAMFTAITHPVVVTLVTRTAVKMNKKDVATKTIANPFDTVYKIQTVKVEVNANYEQRVNEQREAEHRAADFVSQGRTWGTKVSNAITEHNGQQYLNAIVLERVGEPTYETDTVKYVDPDHIAPFITAQRVATSQHVDDPVKYCTYKLSSIQSITFDQADNE